VRPSESQFTSLICHFDRTEQGEGAEKSLDNPLMLPCIALMRAYCVYLLSNRSGTLYLGVTSNLQNRLEQHLAPGTTFGSSSGSKFMRRRVRQSSEKSKSKSGGEKKNYVSSFRAIPNYRTWLRNLLPAKILLESSARDFSARPVKPAVVLRTIGRNDDSRWIFYGKILTTNHPHVTSQSQP
jgi:hypothetical protein